MSTSDKAPRKLITFACQSQKSPPEADATAIVAVFFSIRALHGFLKQLVQLRSKNSSNACMLNPAAQQRFVPALVNKRCKTNGNIFVL
jgi:hypothetical protein